MHPDWSTFFNVDRVYLFHIRKTAGSSLCSAFDGVEGFESAHSPAWLVEVPEEAFTVTILRDPVSRVVSYYRYLLWAIDHPDAHGLEPDIDAIVAEGALIDGGLRFSIDQIRKLKTESSVRELGVGQFARRLLARRSGFDGFLARVPPRKLLTQLHMFSRRFDPGEAAENILECDEVLFTESFSEGLNRLGGRLGVDLEERHERRFGERIELSENELEVAPRPPRAGIPNDGGRGGSAAGPREAHLHRSAVGDGPARLLSQVRRSAAAGRTPEGAGPGPRLSARALMRLRCLLPATLALLALGVGTASADQASQREAVRAVKEEIGSRWLLLETVPRSVHSRGAKAKVECDEVPRGRFLCSWSARNSLHDQVAQGFALVIQRPHGAEARLFAENCASRGVQPCV